MRALHSTPKEGKPPRAREEEPLEEGAMGKKANGRHPPKHFTPGEETLFIQRYKELVEAGLNDNQLSKKLGEAFGKSADSARKKVQKLREKGKIPENPNNQNQNYFTPEEEALLIQRCNELIQSGLNDSQISKKLGKEFGRPGRSALNKVLNLRRKEKIPENPKNQDRKEFTPEEDTLFIQRCKELIRAGLNDFQISKKLGGEFGRRADSVSVKFRKLRKDKKIPENPNNQDRKEFTPEEEALIITSYKELIQAGMNDSQISKKLEEETGRAAKKIGDKIVNLRKSGKLSENPNKGNSSMQMSADERSAAVQGVLDELDKFGGSQ